MKRFIVFAAYQFEANGGISDFIGTVNTADEALDLVKGKGYGWMDLVEAASLDSGKPVVVNYEPDYMTDQPHNNWIIKT